MNDQNPAPSDLKIKIGLVGKRITTDPPGRPHVASRGTLTWECASGPWVVVFDQGQSAGVPFEDNDGERRRNDGKNPRLRKHTGQAREYKYSVALYDDSSGDVYLADPEVVVDPEDD